MVSPPHSCRSLWIAKRGCNGGGIKTAVKCLDHVRDLHLATSTFTLALASPRTERDQRLRRSVDAGLRPSGFRWQPILPFLVPQMVFSAAAAWTGSRSRNLPGSIRAIHQKAEPSHTVKLEDDRILASKSAIHENHHEHDHQHEHGPGHHDDHTHSHGIFSMHTHSHDERYQKGASVIEALQAGKQDRGSRITLIGLVSNVGLTAGKGAAGWFMNSASLLADAGHSASDLLGDFVTLFCWKLSKTPATAKYPYGFGKFETMGTMTVSLLLIGGAVGIGFHSIGLLVDSFTHAAATLPPGPAQATLQSVAGAAQSLTSATSTIGLEHSHNHTLDPNAAWVAALSVVMKEWLYRATKKVADDERSSVLLANAIHHRSDAYSSFVALAAILGSWYFPALPLDPLGGLLVSFVILQQGASLFTGAFRELVDAGVSSQTHQSLQRVVDRFIQQSPVITQGDTNISILDLRAKRSGALMFVDLDLQVPSSMNIEEADSLGNAIREALKEEKKEIYEVKIQYIPGPTIHSPSEPDVNYM